MGAGLVAQKGQGTTDLNSFPRCPLLRAWRLTVTMWLLHTQTSCLQSWRKEGVKGPVKGQRGP